MVRLLSVLLLLLGPANFALELAGVLPSLRMRGVPGAVELVFHGVVAAFAMAAVRALWSASPSAQRLAAIAVGGITVVNVQSLYWSVLPHQTMPGDKPWLAALAVAHGAFWLVYLTRARLLRDQHDLSHDVAALEQPMRLRRSSEGERPIDDRRDLAGRQ
jgi:hypothetical protein